MRHLFYFLFCSVTINLAALVYDVFPFFNEFDILEIRLNELKDVVDYFVIVEAAETFSGKPKPFNLEDYAKRYPEFAHKIIYKKNEGRLLNSIGPHYEREWLQRNYFNHFIKTLRPNSNDIVIVSDLDEIPRASVLKKAVNLIKSKKHEMIALEVIYYRHFLNRLFINKENSPLPVITNYKTFSLYTYMGIRRHRQRVKRLKNGGWHFSTITSPDGYLEKMLSTYKTGSNEQATQICINQFNETKKFQLSSCTKRVPIDKSYPRFVLDNLEKYRAKGYIDE